MVTSGNKQQGNILKFWRSWSCMINRPVAIQLQRTGLLTQYRLVITLFGCRLPSLVSLFSVCML